MTKKSVTHKVPINAKKKPSFHSRYGDPRWVIPHGAGWFTIEGPSGGFLHAGMNEANTEIAYADPSGGPFIAVGDVWPELDGQRIISISIENSDIEDYFKVRVETEQ